jgi:1,4-dihydroxy-2-naphthoate octaprenyltransferase
VRYFAAWAALIAAIALIGLWFAFQAEASRFVMPFLAVAIAIRSLNTIIHQENMKRFRPILEALLSAQVDAPKQEIVQTPRKRASARPRKR